MKTIIIYTTKYGSAENAATILKSKMEGEVKLVNLMKEEVPELDGYDNVVLGGSIYAGKIQKKLSKFVHKNLSILMKKRVGLFICAGEKEQEVREKELVNAFPNELSAYATCKEIFGYEIHYERLNFLEKKLVGAILGHKKGCSELSEDKIGSFAKGMLSKSN